MKEGDGVSFAEFSYPIMQGWDWWTLFDQQNVQMQIGGSDQYGNIVTGIEIVKAVRDSEPDPAKRKPFSGPIDDPVGFTVPLLLDSAGAKFGKSAGNAVWLDQFMTTTFDLYGYFVRRPDDDVGRLLKLFTFMPSAAIQNVMEKQTEDPSKRIAQHCLAYEVLALVHGQAAADQARQQHAMMYSKGGPTTSLVTQALDEMYEPPVGPTTSNNAPRIDMKLPRSLIMNKSIGRILYAARLATSASDGHRLATQQGAYIGGLPGRRPGKGEAMDPSMLTWNPVSLWFPQETEQYLIDNKLLILRKGKHNVRIIQVVDDLEYEESGERYPGMPFTGRIRELKKHLDDMKTGRKTADEARENIDGLGMIDGQTFPKKKSLTESKIRGELNDLIKMEEKKRMDSLYKTSQALHEKQIREQNEAWENSKGTKGSEEETEEQQDEKKG
jgi:tyrosyl-tRNA synthetase